MSAEKGKKLIKLVVGLILSVSIVRYYGIYFYGANPMEISFIVKTLYMIFVCNLLYRAKVLGWVLAFASVVVASVSFLSSIVFNDIALGQQFVTYYSLTIYLLSALILFYSKSLRLHFAINRSNEKKVKETLVVEEKIVTVVEEIDKPYSQDDFFKKLKEESLKAINNKIEAFSQSVENNEIYALILDHDSVHGTMMLAINSEEMLARKVKDKYSHYKESEINGVLGLKYSSADFNYFVELAKDEETLRSLLRTYYDIQINDQTKSDSLKSRYQKAFHDMCVEIVNQANLSLLNQTSYFMKYALNHDISLEEILASMQKSNDLSLINQNFPELRQSKDYLAHIKAMGNSVYVHFLVKAIVNFIVTTDAELKETLEKIKVTRFDLVDELKPLKLLAVNEIFKVLPTYIDSPYITHNSLIPILELIEYNEKASEKDKIPRAKPKETEVSETLLMTLLDIAILTKEQEGYLFNVLKRKIVEYQNHRTKDLRITMIARVLHAAYPSKYPKAMIGGKNELVNQSDFGI